MRTVPTFTFSILTLASLEAAAALSATVPPAWLKAEVSLPEHSRSPLVVKLSPDMTPCRAKYGNEAASKCSRLFGLVSSRVTGVSLSPAVEGVWRWEARGALAFTPEEPWPERTTFKVDLSGLRLPSATTLNTPVIDFTTPPLTMTSGFATFSPSRASAPLRSTPCSRRPSPTRRPSRPRSRSTSPQEADSRSASPSSSGTISARAST